MIPQSTSRCTFKESIRKIRIFQTTVSHDIVLVWSKATNLEMWQRYGYFFSIDGTGLYWEWNLTSSIFITQIRSERRSWTIEAHDLWPYSNHGWIASFCEHSRCDFSALQRMWEAESRLGLFHTRHRRRSSFWAESGLEQIVCIACSSWHISRGFLKTSDSRATKPSLIADTWSQG